MTDRDLKPENVLQLELLVSCGICAARPGERCSSLVSATILPLSHARRRALASSAFVKEMQP